MSSSNTPSRREPEGEFIRPEDRVQDKIEKAFTGSTDFFSIILSGLAEEIDSMRIARRRVEKAKGDATYISEKIVKAYKILADVAAEQRKAATDSAFSFHNPYVVELIRAMLSSVNDVLSDLKVNDNEREVFFHKINQRLIDIEDRVMRNIKNQ
jgi:hypothetical protein